MIVYFDVPSCYRVIISFLIIDLHIVNIYHDYVNTNKQQKIVKKEIG